MFREMRRMDRKTDDDRAFALLGSAEYGILSMVSTEGYGYGVPVNHVYYKGAIYFHCANEGSKIDYIKANNKVSFCVVGTAEPVPEQFTTKFESVIVFGRASTVEGAEKDEAFVALVDRFCHDYMDKGMEMVKNMMSKTTIIKIEIEHITGKARTINK